MSVRHSRVTGAYARRYHALSLEEDVIPVTSGVGQMRGGHVSLMVRIDVTWKSESPPLDETLPD